ncbi:alpha-ketoglutarate-dependent dioxygenase AlkB family protein [Tsukamurella ocularis]|uniref:alpha-ketoglutarate-dependent dioxygenase AlkB family protein n=1 Tax=Tsukamurella ocularis TaxID=1970234 RepID=UPI002167F8D8|nr:alpha-ketoglutarate-dependent dioxygenase AlkB [Tsukamurella ocularis]MCS3778610.1 alkylated DNA repair protein (DNA oxidative demethylase) [Tsukamurella ocularis]MCS3789311.1 alkylated DNA repair protein (DNA oxidative demethylase) [Tsukamurella ocularis]MCS3851293.1 alkylated DNA repair protein (DNA oxidative demethylase) [Tsukamurella ocularis]
MGSEMLFPPDRSVVDLAPGAYLIRGWLDLTQQEWIVRRFREWAAGPVPIRAATVRGHPMSVRTVSLGWHWQPYRYSRDATDVNGARVLPFPDWLVRVGRRALADTGHVADEVERYTPDTALVNFYDERARMGMHQDKDEVSRAPVVSLSIGDSCTFRLGNTKNRNRPYSDVTLESGDLVVFGGPSRLAFHGVTAVQPGTAPPDCGLKTGRINLTLRETGMEG